MTRNPQASMERDNPGHRTAPPREANDLYVTSVITVGWVIALVVMLILMATGTLPANQRWWVWTCGTGAAMGLFGLWYVPVLQRNRARAAARHAAEATRPGQLADAGDRADADAQASGYTSRDNGSKTVSSTETPGSSTRS